MSNKRLSTGSAVIVSSLFLTNLFAVYHFLFSDSEGVLIDALQASTVICWPFLESCWQWRPFLAQFGTALCWGLVIFSVFGVLASWTLTARFALATAVLTLLIKYTLILQDYILMGNFHYITLALWAQFFILHRDPERALRGHLVTLSAFYVCAGLLKFNSEWLSGSIIANFIVEFQPLLVYSKTMDMARPFLPLTNILIELAGPILLLSRSRGSLALGLVVFTAFHLVSSSFVGVTFPGTMLLVLIPGWFALFRRVQLPSFFPGGTLLAEWRMLAVPLIMLLLQLPSFILSSDAALTSEGRVWSVNMLDAHPRCQTFMLLQMKPNEWIDLSGSRTELGPRLNCDPIIMLGLMRSYCRDFSLSGSSALGLWSRRSHEITTHEIFTIPEFCSAPPTFNTLFNNDWIRL